MKKYKVTGKIVLSFILENEQHDILLEPREDSYLESNGATVWYVQKGERFESITTSNVIDVGLKRGDIMESKAVRLLCSLGKRSVR